MFFRSGYIEQRLLQRLKHYALTGRQEKRVRRLVLRSLDGGGRRAFRGYSRLAGRLKTDGLHAEVEKRSRYTDAEVARRAEAVLQYLEIAACGGKAGLSGKEARMW